jgi:uncharacterized protein YdiU (UPF0061 family)
MAAGFVHGVLNTDNINITGESFDYGPWRFTPTFNSAFTAAYFDSAGLYSYGRQAEAIHWDVVQLAIALTSIADQSALEQAIAAFAPAYRAALIDKLLWRLGVVPRDAASDLAIVQTLEAALTESQTSIDHFFFDWTGGVQRRGEFSHAAFDPLRNALAGYEPRIDLIHPYWSSSEPCNMLIEDVETIWKRIADADDWSLLNAKVTAIRQMGDALANRFPAA